MEFKRVKEVKEYFEKHPQDAVVHQAIEFLLGKTNDVVPGQFVGIELTDFYCNGFFGRRYDLNGAKIIASGVDFITIRDNYGEECTAYFDEGWRRQDMLELIEDWTK